jgi:hypothetical protein
MILRPLLYKNCQLTKLPVLLLAACAFALARGDDSPSPTVDQEQIDSSGTVWAAKQYKSGLYAYDGQTWKSVPTGLASDANAEFRGMATAPDGAVIATWFVKGEGLAVTRHSGSTTTLVGAEKDDKQDFPNLLHPQFDSKGNVWLSGCSPRVYKTDGNGGITLVHEFATDDFKSREKKRMITTDLYNPLQVQEDGLGRMWVWSGTTGSTITPHGTSPNLDSSPSLHGVYLISGDKVELHDQLGPIEVGDFFAIVRLDDQHMVVSDSANGVYKVDIGNWKTESLPGNQIELRNVHELHVDGSDLYAIDRFRGGDLYQWSGTQWNNLIPDLESSTAGIGYAPRTWIHADNGLIIQSFTHESWFLPKSGPPKMLSWKSSFPIPGVQAIVRLKNGIFCVIGSDSQVSFHEIPNPNDQTSSHRVIEVEPAAAWLPAKDIWMVPKADYGTLKVWDGKTWQAYTLPNKGRGDCFLNEDDRGMVWIYNNDGAADIFDPAKKQWTGLPRFDDCLAATKGNPVHFQHFWQAPFPRYSADKQRIAYYAATKEELHYFDGSVWRIFKAPDITGWPGDGEFNAPWFDAKDKLTVSNRANVMWQYDENGQWASAPYISHPTDGYDPPTEPKWIASDLQKQAMNGNPNSIRADSVRTYWYTANGNLYRCGADQWVSIFDPGEVTPLNSNPILLAVDLDSHGNVFINTLAAETHRFLILAKHPLPQTTIGLKKLSEDSFTVTFGSNSSGILEFGWQLDDNQWVFTKNPELILDHLSNGTHTIRAFAVDDQLNRDWFPATTQCEVKVDSAKQITMLIDQFKNPDYNIRKEAVAALSQQAKLSLPALLAAKATANEDELWWIDATLQEIDSKKALNPNR